MSNRNLVPVYYDQNSGEFVADFAWFGKPKRLLQIAGDEIVRNAKGTRGNLYLRAKKAVNKAGSRLMAGNSTVTKNVNNGETVIARKMNNEGIKGIGNKIATGVGSVMRNNSGAVVNTGLGLSALGTGYGVNRVISDRRRDAKNKKYGGLGRYLPG